LGTVGNTTRKKIMAHIKYTTKDGEVVPSVTTVIGTVLGFNKNALLNWTKYLAFKGQDADKVKKSSASIGTSAHYLIECKIKNEKFDRKELRHLSKDQLIQTTNAYKGWKQWEDDWKPEEYLYTEISMVSEKYKFGGTVDIVAKKDNKIYILDNKTSNSLHMEMIVQLGAYKLLFEENHDEPIHQCGIIKVEKKTPSYSLKLVSDKSLKAGQEMFLKALDIQNLKSKVTFK
jgi:hypothetical protein